MSVKPPASYRKVRRVALLYDMDLSGKQTLIRVDLIIQSADLIITPVVSLYEARFTQDNPNALAARGFDPRQLLACFEILNKIVNRTIFNPYRPSHSNHKGLINELYNLSEIKTLKYTGESHERDYQRFN
ncbi:hypothetical protein [Microcystis sp. M061S2]|uniref:hypothetical protein n=1 Tax=Microcystis sp. M061S2 TaxID=2771171 RepID=UPI00258EB188|nr:hypothetical protein [Microcystis sp. M061S2]MCA2652896.1 hypothetical protein [Microcystis sp. M061S2]